MEASSSWQDEPSSAISRQNRRHALEILHHDPLHIENDEEVENGEAVSLLFHTNDLNYVDVTYEHDGDSNRASVCGGFCRRYPCRVFTILLVVMTSVVMLATTTQVGVVKVPSLPHVNLHPQNNDMCRDIFNKTIAELMQEVEIFSQPNDWCQNGNPDGSCTCQSTLSPSQPSWNSQAKQDLWLRTMERNTQLLKEHNSEVDVVLYGDSITEHWLGTELSSRWEQWQGNKEVFDETFGKDDADVHAVAMGIAGDETAQLLYRLENGELPRDTNANVYWILIGTNNLSKQCSAEAVVAGNIRIVQYLQRNRPGATIVLNSILPRGAPRGDDLTDSIMWQQIQRVNQWLQCYADSTAGVEFFNATSLFVVSYNGVVHQVKDYFYDDVHPSEQGSKGWATAIKHRVQELIRR